MASLTFTAQRSREKITKFTSVRSLSQRTETANIFGVEGLSEEDKKFKFKFQPSALKDWEDFARQHLNFSNELIREHLCEDMRVSESVLHELYKMSVNSLIFRDYLKELSDVVEVDKDGAMTLLDEDIANVWKCLRTLSESKNFLKDACLSLELH